MSLAVSYITSILFCVCLSVSLSCILHVKTGHITHICETLLILPFIDILLRLVGGLWKTNDIEHRLHSFLASSTFIFNFQASLCGPPSLPWKTRHQVTRNSLDRKCRSSWNYGKVQCRPVPWPARNVEQGHLQMGSLWIPFSELLAHAAGSFCSDQVWTQHGQWSFSTKNLICLPYILQVNHSCLSCKGDGSYTASGLPEQILKFLPFFEFQVVN